MTRLVVGTADTGVPPSGRIIRGTAAYAVGSVLQRAVMVLLLPVFTRILTPEEFGQVGVLTTMAAAISVFVSFGLETAIFRGYRQALPDPERAHRFLNTVGGFALVVPPVAAAAFSVVIAPTLAETLGVEAAALQLASLGAAFTASAVLVPLSVLRAQERHRQYVQVTAIQLAVTVALTLLLVAALDLGVTGWMLAYALGSFALLGLGLIVLSESWDLTFDPKALKGALLFGVPLVPHAMSHWGLSVSDRAILGASVPGQEVGAYYVAYLLCLPISLVAIATAQATQPMFTVASGSSKHQGDVGRVVSVQAIMIGVTAVAVALIGPPVILLALPTSYSMAAMLIPWLALGTALFGLYLMPMNAITLTVGRTQRVWMITVIAAGLNIGLNLVLVPSIGTMAAAVNTTIGYGVLLIGVFIYQRRVCDPPLPYDVGRVGLGLLVVGISAAGAAFMTEADSVLSVAIRALVIVGSAAVLLAGPFRAEAKAAIRAIRPRGVGEPA